MAMASAELIYRCPACAELGPPVLLWPGLRPGCCGPNADRLLAPPFSPASCGIRGYESDSSPLHCR